jgi:hypothetical protein
LDAQRPFSSLPAHVFTRMYLVDCALAIQRRLLPFIPEGYQAIQDAILVRFRKSLRAHCHYSIAYKVVSYIQGYWRFSSAPRHHQIFEESSLDRRIALNPSRMSKYQGYP